MGHCISSNYISPEESLSVVPHSSRAMVKRGREHPFWRLSMLSCKTSFRRPSTKRTEVIDHSFTEQRDSLERRKSILLAKTFLRCSLIDAAARNLEDVSAVVALSQKVQAVVQAINNSAVLTDDEKQFVLTDFEEAQLTCSDDDDDEEMAKLLQQLLVSYQDTSTIQSSKYQELLRLQQLCHDLQQLSELCRDNPSYCELKTHLLKEMKSLFLQLLTGRGSDGIAEGLCD